MTFKKIAFIANTLFEFAVAIGTFAAAAGDNISSAPIITGNAIGLGTLSLAMINRENPEHTRAGTVALAAFHTSITLIWLIFIAQTKNFNPAAIVHALFAATFIYLARKDFVKQV